ncbi:MAG TPA: tetratricopeptide repeat protein, partial [Nitrospira sp.]|nr:tetratricopeptide repeat protein [Nitrospira sp.]
GNRVRINARLVDGSTERILWEEPFERDLGDVLVLYRDVARAIAERIRITVTPEELQRLASARPINPMAYDAYLRGRFFLSKRTGEDTRKGLGNFDQAVEIDPSYAPAYAGIADAYLTLAYYGPIPPAVANAKAREAAVKAVTLDDSLAEAHNSLAEVHFHYDWDWSWAEREYRRAIALNPGYAKAHHGYSVFLDAMGRHDEALAEIRRARELDPLSLIINTAVGTALFYCGDYDLAIKQWQSTLDLNPNFWVARLWLGIGYSAKGPYEDGVKEFESAVELSKGHPSALGWLGYGYAISGKTAKSREILAKLQQKAKEGYVPPFEVAVACAGLGDKDQAFGYLEKAFQERYFAMPYLSQERFPLWRPLHSDPRYRDILRRMNFPKGKAGARD